MLLPDTDDCCSLVNVRKQEKIREQYLVQNYHYQYLADPKIQ